MAGDSVVAEDGRAPDDGMSAAAHRHSRAPSAVAIPAAVSSTTHHAAEADLEFVLRAGREAVAATLLLPHMQRWRTDDALVGYVDVGGTRVVAGAPLGDPTIRLEHPRVVVFGRELDDDEPLPREAFVVGEQPWWRTAQWSQTVAQKRSLRSQLHRAHNKGVRCDVVDPAALHSSMRLSIERLLHDWLATRSMAPMGFVAAVDPLHLLAVRTVVVAHVDDSLVGVAFAFPLGSTRAVIDHVLRAPHAPNGTSDALIDAMMQALATRGVDDVTMGLCPLAGRVPRALQFVRDHSHALFDFAGLYAFKARCAPQRWQRIIVEHPGQSAVMGTWRALRAFAGGSFVRFGWQTLVHRLRRWGR